MPTYIPTTTFFPNNVVTLVSADVTPYDSIIESMGSVAYGISEMYINASNINQILQPYRFNKKNPNGNIESYTFTPSIDPYQYQSVVKSKLKTDNVVLDGKTAFDFPMLPDEFMNVVLYTNKASVKSLVPETKFFSSDFFSLYKDYKDEL